MSDVPERSVLCRLCTKSDDFFVNIFIKSESCKIIVEEAIQDLLGLKVAVGDGLPSTACQQCVMKLIEFCEFKDKCIQSETELRANGLCNDFSVGMKDRDSSVIKDEFFSDEDPVDNDSAQTADASLETMPQAWENQVGMKECDSSVIKDEFFSEEVPAGNDSIQTLDTSLETMPEVLEKSLKQEADEHKGASLEGNNPESTSLNQIQVTEVYIPIPDQEAVRSVCHVGDGWWPETESVVKGEISDGVDCAEADIPVASPSGVSVDPLAVDPNVDDGYGVAVTQEEAPNTSMVYGAEIQETTSGKAQNNSSNLKNELLPNAYARGNKMVFQHGEEDPDFVAKGEPAKQAKIRSRWKPCKCDICGKQFTRKSSLNAHVTIHMGSQQFKCEICGSRFAERGNLKKHAVIHTGLRPFKCEICGKDFNKKWSLTMHAAVHAGFKCKICGSQFSERESLKEHAVTHGGLRSFKCDICRKGFNSKRSLKSHIADHTGKNRFQCEICGSWFAEKAALKGHAVIHSGSRPFKCDICGKDFYKKGNLNRHKAFHSGLKPFVCEICGNRFTERSSYKKHAIIHSGARPFKCDICGKAFTQKGHLKEHATMHSALKPFKCTTCGKEYTTKSSLSNHEMTHVGFKCDICGKRYSKKCSLKKHVNIHHN